MNKKLVAMMSAMVMCFSAMPICTAYAETDVDVMPEIPVDVQDVLPEWIPQNFTEALRFDNKYGKTHIEDGLICCVREKSKDECLEYSTEYSDDSQFELLLNETYNFELPEKPDESDEEAYQEYLDFLHSNGISEFEVENNLIYVDFEYEVTVYSLKATESVEINWIKKYKNSGNTDITTLSFESSADGEVTETDLYGWLPDTMGEGYSFMKKNGEISVHDDYIVICSDICWDGGYSMVVEQDGMAKLELAEKEVSSERYIVPLGGGSLMEVQLYKPVTSGTVKVTFKEARTWEADGKEVNKVVKCYNVSEDGTITEIDESEVTPLNIGDCNLDGKIGISDVVTLKKWLMGSGELECWQNADFNNDNKVDVFDLVLMKQSLLEKLPAISQDNENVTDNDMTMLKQTVLEKYAGTDMTDFTFVYNPDHKLNSYFNGKLFSVYYKGVLVHGYGDINTDSNAYAVIRNEKDNLKSVDMNFIVSPERFKEVNLDGEYKSVEEIKESVDKYEMESAVTEPQFIIYADHKSGFDYELKPAYVIEWHDYERIYDAVTGEEIEYIPYFVV